MTITKEYWSNNVCFSETDRKFFSSMVSHMPIVPVAKLRSQQYLENWVYDVEELVEVLHERLKTARSDNIKRMIRRSIRFLEDEYIPRFKEKETA